MDDAEQMLVALIRKLFADTVCDGLVKMKAAKHPELAAAIEHVIPGCRAKRRSRHTSFGFRNRLVDPVLIRLAEEHFDVNRFGWWQVKGKAHEHAHGHNNDGCRRLPQGNPGSSD